MESVNDLAVHQVNLLHSVLFVETLSVCLNEAEKHVQHGVKYSSDLTHATTEGRVCQPFNPHLRGERRKGKCSVCTVRTEYGVRELHNNWRGRNPPEHQRYRLSSLLQVHLHGVTYDRVHTPTTSMRYC